MAGLRPARRLRGGLLALPLGVLLVFFLFIPLCLTFWQSIGGAELTFAHYAQALTSRNNLSILLHTLKISALVTLATLVLGYPVACLMTRLGESGRTVISLFLLVPLFTAFLIRTYAWMIILGRKGIVNTVLIGLGVIDRPADILNTSLAVVIGMVHVLLPMAIFTMYSAMVRLPTDPLRATEVLGARPVQVFVRVWLPMSLPGVFSAAVLIFIIAMGFYITPALLGGPADTMISQMIVVQMTTLLNFPLGFATANVLLIVVLAILFIAGLFVPLESIWSPAGADAAGPVRRLRPGRWLARRLRPLGHALETGLNGVISPLIGPHSLWLRGYAAAMVLFLNAPLAVVVILSFSSSSFVLFPPPGFSLRWWQKLMQAQDWHAAFLSSLRLGLVVALLSVAIGGAGAFWLVRSRVRAKRAVFLLALAPLMVPVIVIATALYFFESRIGLLGSFAGLVAGHVLLAVPYVVVVAAAALRNLDRSIEDAAAIHGARPLQIARRITLPLLWPALATGGILAFLTSFDELLLTTFLIGRQAPTLPIKFWGDIRYQIDPLLSSASTLIVLIVIAAIVSVPLIRTRVLRKRT